MPDHAANAHGAAPIARVLLIEDDPKLEDILTQAASSLHEPLFLRDASRLARLRQHAGSSAGVGDPLVLSMLLETAGRTHMR